MISLLRQNWNILVLTCSGTGREGEREGGKKLRQMEVSVVIFLAIFICCLGTFLF
jgi:hypothetical protein